MKGLVFTRPFLLVPPLVSLDDRYIRSLWTFRTLNDVEFDLLSFFKSSEALHVDCRVVDEDVCPVLLCDEAVTFLGVEPLNCSSHFQDLLKNC